MPEFEAAKEVVRPRTIGSAIMYSEAEQTLDLAEQEGATWEHFEPLFADSDEHLVAKTLQTDLKAAEYLASATEKLIAIL